VTAKDAVEWGMPEALRYLDQVLERYDPDLGLLLPEQLAACVSLELYPDGRVIDDAGAAWSRLLAALLRDPGAPRLRTLILADWSAHASDPWDVAYESGDPAPLLRRHARRLAALERLYIGGFPDGRGSVCQGIGAALAGLTALTRLELVGERGWELLASAGHPRLRELIVRVAEPDDEPLAVLLAGTYPQLGSLELACSEELVELAAEGSLLAGLAELPTLRRLALRGLDDPAALAGLAGGERRGAIDQLALIDAPGLDDAALAPLLAAAWLPGLTRLELTGTAVSPALAAELAARGPSVART
jgi:hypothetical protein